MNQKKIVPTCLNPLFKHSFLFILLTLFSCTKDTIEVIPDPTDEETEEVTGCDGVFETIYTYFDEDGKVSGSYIAAYPGSWWEY